MQLSRRAARRTAVVLMAAALATVLGGCGGVGASDRTAVWRLVGESDGGRTLAIRWQHGVGDRLARIDVDETTRSVTITVHVTVVQGTVIALLRGSTSTVHLLLPLGHRALRHGPAEYGR